MLYLRYSIINASPKAISGRTSYLRVRLEFHRYPQVIAGHCNERAFGPPWGFTPTSTCSWVGHPVSGLLPLTLYALLTLGFPSPPVLNTLSSPVTITRRTILQKVPHQPLTVLFHSPPGVLFTFPSRYCSSIGHQVVFRVGGWSPQFPTGFHVSCGTLDPD